MRRISRALWNSIRGVFWLIFHLVEAAVTAVITAVIAAITGTTVAAARIYYSHTVRIVGIVYAALLIIVPLLSLVIGVFLWIAGFAAGNDWIILAGGAVPIGGTVGTYLLLLPALFLLSVLIAILQGLFGAASHVYREYILATIRALQRRIGGPDVTVFTPVPAPAPAPAAATPIPTATRPARP